MANAVQRVSLDCRARRETTDLACPGQREIGENLDCLALLDCLD